MMFGINWEKVSEGDCRAAAFVALAKALPRNYLVRTELKLPRGLGGSKRGARLDMAILERATGRIVLVLETKRSAQSKAEAQGRRYSEMTKAPVMYLRGMEECQACAPRVVNALPRIAAGHDWAKLDLRSPAPG